MARRGFTLLEIMVATVILGLVLLSVYGVLSRALLAKEHAEEQADLYASGREVVLRIADEIEGALPPTAGRYIGFIGIPGSSRVPTDAVQFGVVIHRLFGASRGRGGRALVSYSLDPLQNAPNLFALRRQEELLTEPAAEDGDPQAGEEDAPAVPAAVASYIADQVAGLRLRYLDPETGEWVDSWDTTAERPGQGPRGLPGAVEVTVFLADDAGGVHDFGTIVDLPLANLAL
ncbi:MAG: prepilin-type N-terminal cleavage/methylation domain-containing protein [Candidatus Binatia bacterium]